MARFALVADGGQLVQQGRGAVRAMGDAIAGARHVVLLLAAADVTLLQVKAPPLSAARLKAALPNLIEEQILGDPEDCVIVASPVHGEDGVRTVAVAQRPWLEALVKSLLAQGARTVAALPSQLCLPMVPGNVAGAIDEHGITLRHGAWQGLGLALDGSAPVALQTARALAGDAPLTLYVEHDQLGQYQALVAEAGPGIVLETEHWAHWIAGSKSTTLDLVPGLGAAGAPVRDWSKWRWPLRLALLAVVINIVGLNLQWLRMRSEAKAITLGMNQSFTAAFPRQPLSSDVEAQMRQNIERSRARFGQVSPEEFTYIAAALGESMRSVTRVPEVVSLGYRERTVTVKVKPETVDPAAVSQIKALLLARRLDLTDAGAGVWSIRALGVKK